MVTEDYVSFETAKLLKEKGFEEDCHAYWDLTIVTKTPKIGLSVFSKNWNYKWNPFPFLISAPTLQMAMKWLREKHNLHCHSDYDIVLGWYCQITSLTETVEYDYEEMKHYHPDKDNGFSSPEEACEAAIKYCLEKMEV